MPFRRRPEPEPDPDGDPSVWAPPREEFASQTHGSGGNGPAALPEAPEERSRILPALPESGLPDPGPPAAELDEPEIAAADEPETSLPVAPPVSLPVVTDAEGAVRAAGGVVWTDWGDSGLRVLVVHRPRYDDWSLPKGKAHPGETDLACATREVREETGLTCSLGEELPSTTYLDRHGRVKTVRYWAMQPLGGSLQPDTEVDDARWVSVDEARGLLSYERDAEVLNALLAVLDPPAGAADPAL